MAGGRRDLPHAAELVRVRVAASTPRIEKAQASPHIELVEELLADERDDVKSKDRLPRIDAAGLAAFCALLRDPERRRGATS